MRAVSNILIIGTGGIGALLARHVYRAINLSHVRKKICGKLTIMDGDNVESRNLSHQPFTLKDVMSPKVETLAEQLSQMDSGGEGLMSIVAVAENFSKDTNLAEYDLVVVAVDREEPRNLVHANAKQWLDLRARGDGFVMCSHKDGADVLDNLPKLPAGQSASCQLEGAIDGGNIQFGFALAAAHGAQWIIQWLRNSNVPKGKMYTIHMGELQFPTKNNEVEV